MKNPEKISNLQTVREVRLEAVKFVADHGHDIYYDFILEHGRRPNRDEASSMGMLLGRQVQASDGSLQPTKLKNVRAKMRRERQAEKANLRLDLELSRALDAIGFLAKNEIDAAPLIARISTFESEGLTEQLQKALLWLNRFADGWLTHVNIGVEKAEISVARDSGSVGRKGLHIIRSSNCSS